jgi:hypothetical protein
MKSEDSPGKSDSWFRKRFLAFEKQLAEAARLEKLD